MTLGTSVLFRSTDASAPQFSATPGTLNTVLKAVLVNGYGSKASLGWTLEYEDVAAKVCVYRMKGGTRMFIRVDDSGISPATADCAHVTAYTSMINAHSGTEKTPNPLSAINVYIHKRYSSGAGNVPWMIIGDDAGFYLINRPGFPPSPTTTVALIHQVHYFGDYVKYDQKNMWNFCLIGMSSTSWTACSFQPSSAFQVQRGATHTRALVTTYLQGIGSGFGYNYSTAMPVQIAPSMGSLIEYPIRIFDATNQCVLGILPGISDILQKQSNDAFTASPNTVPYWERTDSDGILKMLVTSGGVSYTNPPNTHQTIFRVGVGFRDVR